LTCIFDILQSVIVIWYPSMCYVGHCVSMRYMKCAHVLLLILYLLNRDDNIDLVFTCGILD